MVEFKKYPKIKQLGHEENEELLKDPEDEIVIEEKIDGANFRFMIKDKKIIFGSRTQQLEDDSGGNWKRCIEFIKEKFEKTERQFLEGYIYYGECITKHTMDYDWEKILPFLGFDIYDLETNKFIEEKDVAFAKMGLPNIPQIKVVQAKDIKSLTDDDVPISKYASPSSKDQKAEGIVLKNYNKQIMAKYVREKFKEANRETFGQSGKFTETDDDRIVAMYCTNARIDKIIFKLIDDGHKLETKLMEHLPKRVMEDIYEEHWKEICWSKWSINFHQVRKKISKRCFSVLKQVITNNAFK